MGTPYQEKIRTDLWNDHYPVGTEVTIKLVNGEQLLTKTIGPAELHNGLAFVPVADLAQPALLSKVSPVRINCGRTSSVALELAELSPERT